MSPVAQRRIISIQYLRAVAALAVVSHHTGWTHTTIGAGGVDLFFVISGFVMVHVSGRESDPRVFLRARIVRLVPIYWLLTMVSAVGWRLPADQVVPSLLFWPHSDQAGPISPVIPQGWSLEYEMYFYVVFALVLLAPVRARVWVLSAVFVGLVLLGGMLRPQGPALTVYTNPMLLEFLAGALVRVGFERSAGMRPVLAASLFAAGVLLYILQAPLSGPGGWRALLWGGPFTLMVAGAVGLELAGRVPSLPLLRLLGDSSYSIYLLQFFVLAPLLPVAKRLPAPLAVAVCVAACAVAGVVLYWAAERPLQAWFKRLRRGERGLDARRSAPAG